jgi:hypothetical protein
MNVVDCLENEPDKSWRDPPGERKKIRNVYLGSSQKMSLEQAQELARALKREALGLSSLTPS